MHSLEHCCLLLLSVSETFNICPVGENEDKTQQLDKPEAGGNGIALDNIRHRLVAYYGSNGTLVTNSDAGEFIAVLSFPNQTLQN